VSNPQHTLESLETNWNNAIKLSIKRTKERDDALEQVAALTTERDQLRADLQAMTKERDDARGSLKHCQSSWDTNVKIGREIQSERDTALAQVAQLTASIDAIECKKLRTKDGVLIQGGMNLWVCMDGIFKSGPCRVQLEDGEYGAFVGGSLYSAEWCYSTRAAAESAQPSKPKTDTVAHLKKTLPPIIAEMNAAALAAQSK